MKIFQFSSGCFCAGVAGFAYAAGLVHVAIPCGLLAIAWWMDGIADRINDNKP